MTTKRKLIMPTAEEDAEITAAALGDPDALPLSDEDLAQFRPARELAWPLDAGDQVSVAIAYDPDLLAAYTATGDGWQARMNQALRDWAVQHGLLPAPTAEK